MFVVMNKEGKFLKKADYYGGIAVDNVSEATLYNDLRKAQKEAGIVTAHAFTEGITELHRNGPISPSETEELMDNVRYEVIEVTVTISM